MTSRERDEQGSVIQVADQIRRHGLQSAALVALEAGRPLTFVAAQLVWLAQPMLAMFLPGRDLPRFAELLEDQESVSALIDALGREPVDNRGGA